VLTVNAVSPKAAHPKSLRWQLTAKRSLDIVFSLTGLAILLPLLILVAAMIKFDSKGPIFFSQRRWGMGGQIINVWKFRSMYVDKCDASGVAQTTENDPRVTAVGKLIRRLNIDELPQLFNILRGDMSLVGPRCHAVGMLAAGTLYEELVPQYHERHVMRPGLTGLAQARGWRGPTDTPAKARSRVACDLFYVENFSVQLDIAIMLKTLHNELTDGRGF
jgi:lipopolysaccharide/colanic/teichoic acid biosynthesis glycosyltransferase